MKGRMRPAHRSTKQEILKFALDEVEQRRVNERALEEARLPGEPRWEMRALTAAFGSGTGRCASSPHLLFALRYGVRSRGSWVRSSPSRARYAPAMAAAVGIVLISPMPLAP
jgi:hypothetical protein